MNFDKTGPVLFKLAESIPNFTPKTTISTIFLEFEKRVLLLKRSHKEDQPDTWGIPGGKCKKDETPEETLFRELQEETQLDFKEKKVEYHGKRFARIPGWDYIIHLYRLSLDNKPEIKLNPIEHSAFEWVSLYGFKLMPIMKGQDEAFDVVYGDKIWQRVKELSTTQKDTQKVAELILCKGDQKLVFNSERRFVLNLIGTSGSGKGTQGDMFSSLFGIPNISAGDIFRDEFRNKTKLGWMVENYDKTFYPEYLPDEIPIGMMAKRLGEKDCQLGYILDGFPRTEAQGNSTREVFLRFRDVHIPMFMDVPEKDIWERLPGRDICGNCGHQVRKFDVNPFPGFCPIEAINGKMIKLEKRVEDIDKSKIERRLKMFRDNKDGIISSMNKRDAVKTFPLTNKTPPKEVLHQLCEHIQGCLDKEFDKIKNDIIVDTIRVDILKTNIFEQK